MQTIIAPSILSANLARLGEDVERVLAAGADWIHIDVMDNHYVPNLTFGPMLCRALRQYGITAHLDVHLMVQPVDKLIIEFAKAGANSITFHPEASEHINDSLQLIHDHQCLAGLAFNSKTSLTYLKNFITELDLVLIMSVNPGFAGQQFIPEAINNLEKVRKILDTDGRDKPIRLAVDGGITLDNIGVVAKLGVDTFIAGSAIFNADNYKQVITALKEAINIKK